MIKTLDVMMWGMKVGKLVSARHGYRQQVCFYFDPAFVREGLDIAPLRAPIGGAAAQRGLPIYPEDDRMFGGLPSFIADSLPDRWGNIVFDEWAKANNIRQRDISVLDRLAYIGRRGMGAMEFVPPVGEEMESPFKVEVEKLSELARTAVDEAKGFHARFSQGLAIESLFRVGTSAGGRRPKAVINLNAETGECYSGQVAAPLPGFTPMIIKFDEHGALPSARIEYSYYLMAVAAGLKMGRSRILECAGETHFLTERFDRRGSEKIHVQTLAAMFPTASAYEDLFETAQRMGLASAEMQAMFLQMTMNVLGANVDDHSKNFSFLMDKTGVWHASPVYDYTFTVDLSAPCYVNRQSMTVNGRNEGISREDFMDVAERFNIKGASSLIDKAIGAVSGYRVYAHEAGVPDSVIAKIEEAITARLESL